MTCAEGTSRQENGEAQGGAERPTKGRASRGNITNENGAQQQPMRRSASICRLCTLCRSAHTWACSSPSINRPCVRRRKKNSESFPGSFMRLGAKIGSNRSRSPVVVVERPPARYVEGAAPKKREQGGSSSQPLIARGGRSLCRQAAATGTRRQSDRRLCQCSPEYWFLETLMKCKTMPYDVAVAQRFVVPHPVVRLMGDRSPDSMGS